MSFTLRYRTLNSLAMRLLPPEGGLLMTCSCSGAVAQSSGHFLGMLRVSGALQAVATVAAPGTSTTNTSLWTHKPPLCRPQPWQRVAKFQSSGMQALRRITQWIQHTRKGSI